MNAFSQREVERRGLLLVEHIADMLTVLGCVSKLPSAEAAALADKSADRLKAILAAVDKLEP